MSSEQSSNRWSDLEQSGPVPTPETLGDELWSWFLSLPVDYQRFLFERNGGQAPSGRYSFDVPIEYRSGRETRMSSETCVQQFLPIRASAPKHSCDDLVQWNAYVHEIGSVPMDALAIADCDGSLVCLSLRPEEFGAVYYWEYYADYPWHEEFFRKRRQQALASFERAESVLNDPSHSQFQPLRSALQWARLVRLARDFEVWAVGMRNRAGGDKRVG